MSSRVEKIRTHKALKRNGIEYGKVIALELYDNSFMGHIKHLAKCLLFDFSVEKKGDGKRVMEYSLGYTHRRDYEEIRDTFLKIFPELAYLDIDRHKSIKNTILKMLGVLGRWFHYLFSGVKSPFLCATLVTEYAYLESKIRKNVNLDNIDLLVTFCDAKCEDNLLTQMVQKKGVKTATLQHGQYRVLNEDNSKADMEAYKNFISDYLFAWGEVTRKEFIKAGIDGKRVIPVGALKAYSYATKAPKHENKGVFGVILCGEIYIDTNIAMIEYANKLAERYGMKYFLRMHPKNNPERYLAHVNEEYLLEYSAKTNNADYIAKVDFSIIHMTGVFVEMLGLNSVMFVYDDKYMEDLFKIEPYTFKDEKRLFELYDDFMMRKEEIENDQYQYYTSFNNGNNLEENYKNAMKMIMLEG